MPAYKNESNNTWYCKFYYKDWQGTNQQKKKSGFKRKADAQAWERAFLDKQATSSDIMFSSLVDIYLEDMSHRLRQTTMATKRHIIRLKILPYFKSFKACDISASHVRRWQNKLMTATDEKGNLYKPTYLQAINNQLSAIFNYGVKYSSIHTNPCHTAGSIGKGKAGEMEFWTKEEFCTFIKGMNGNIRLYTAFMTLYYTGMRIGELMALTPADITETAISINKAYSRIKGQDIIAPPKTPKSTRIIVIPNLLYECLKQYQSLLYDTDANARLFDFSRTILCRAMEQSCIATGVKKIRIHDIRHSHASLLIELGFSPLLIAERLGHEKVETTLNTYSHLYPNKQNEIAVALDKL